MMMMMMMMMTKMMMMIMLMLMLMIMMMVMPKIKVIALLMKKMPPLMDVAPWCYEWIGWDRYGIVYLWLGCGIEYLL